jgi:hypothetical protein
MRVINREASPVEDIALAKFKQKFSFPDRPGDGIPDLPRNLDDLSDADLMEVYKEFMSWVSFAKAELVKAEIEEEREASCCHILESKVLIEQWGADAKGDRVTLAKARRDVDPRVITQQELHRKARAYRKLTESVFDRCERGAQLLSRELTRRVGSGPRDNRYAKMTA